MKISKPNFWQKRLHIITILLTPFSLIFLLISKFKKYFISENQFSIPIICVGNIYIGGTGKTPLAIKIADEINYNLKPAIVKKFYKSHKDEHLLIKNKFKDLFLNFKRSDAIKEAIKKKFNLIILDDGFQDYSIKKNLNILCFNSKQLIGNGMLFPSGPLREEFASIKRAKIIVINGNRNESFEEKILKISKDIQIFYSKYNPINLNEFKDKKILAFAGIGNPENFFNLLKDNNINIVKEMKFPDHYNYSKKELDNLVELSQENSAILLTTEKDYFRIEEAYRKKINHLKISVEITNKDNFIKEIKKFI